MLCVLGSTIAGQVVVAFADNLALAFLGVSIVGIGWGVGWPASNALIATVVPQEIRSRYYGMNFSLLNLGIGIGGIIGGIVVDVDRIKTFQAMYLLDALSYLPSLALLLIPLRHIGKPVAAPPDESGTAAPISYLGVLRAPAMKTMTLLMFFAAFIGYAQLNSGVPAYARAVSEISTQGLGLAFAANTLVIVLLQLVVLQRIEGHRRTRVIVLMALVWAMSWGMLAASGISPGTWSATFFVAACASVFALGETLMQPTLPVIVNDLAPDHLRGRYNALSSGTFQLASILGPIVAGFLIGHHLHLEYLGLLVAGCAVVAWLALVQLEPQLDDRTNGVYAGGLDEVDAEVAEAVPAKALPADPA